MSPSSKSIASKKSSTVVPSPVDHPAFRNSLLAWYDANRRDLPWRRTHDPYAIWLSEIMLQQTRVAAVLEHYRAFLERFPEVAALARASEDAVLAAWSGLGYYQRARRLHQCAREVMQKHGGHFPANEQALRSLPGIGRYTAAAIASIAFHQPVAVVDGNVERVLERLYGRELSEQETWQLANDFLDPARPGDFNQAMMEFGATVCLPRQPQCLLCPLEKWCTAKGEIARSRPASRQRRKQIWCVLDCRNEQVRLVRRPSTASLMAGLWELPSWEKLPHQPAAGAHWRSFRHSITVTNYTVHVLRGLGHIRSGKAAKGRWVAIQRIPDLPITGLTRKILKAGGII